MRKNDVPCPSVLPAPPRNAGGPVFFTGQSPGRIILASHPPQCQGSGAEAAPEGKAPRYLFGSDCAFLLFSAPFFALFLRFFSLPSDRTVLPCGGNEHIINGISGNTLSAEPGGVFMSRITRYPIIPAVLILLLFSAAALADGNCGTEITYGDRCPSVAMILLFSASASVRTPRRRSSTSRTASQRSGAKPSPVFRKRSPSGFPLPSPSSPRTLSTPAPF